VVIKRRARDLLSRVRRVGQEFHVRVQDRIIRRFIKVVQGDETEPQKVVRTVRDRPDIRAVVPPVAHGPVGKLLRGMQQDLFFGEFGPRREKRSGSPAAGPGNRSRRSTGSRRIFAQSRAEIAWYFIQILVMKFMASSGVSISVACTNESQRALTLLSSRSAMAGSEYLRRILSDSSRVLAEPSVKTTVLDSFGASSRST